MNSLAAIAVASELNVPAAAIKNALKNFQGINRRFEILGQISIDSMSVLLIDDYAHHPTEIRAILEAIRSGWSDRRIVVVFQPHRYTRTQILFREFCEVLSELDLLILLNIYPAGETEIPGIDSLSLCKEITGKGKSTPVFVENRDELITSLPGLLNDQDILLILGAGDIGSLGNELFSKFDGTVH